MFLKEGGRGSCSKCPGLKPKEHLTKYEKGYINVKINSNYKRLWVQCCVYYWTCKDISGTWRKESAFLRGKTFAVPQNLFFSPNKNLWIFWYSSGILTDHFWNILRWKNPLQSWLTLLFAGIHSANAKKCKRKKNTRKFLSQSPLSL